MDFFNKFTHLFKFGKLNSDSQSYAYPGEGKPLLNAYGGKYEACFIILNHLFQTEQEDFWEDFDEHSKNVKFIKWQDVIDQTEIRDINQLHHVLASYNGRLRQEFHDVAGVNCFERYINSIIYFNYVSEDEFDDFHRSEYISIFKDYGDQVIIVPEFPPEKSEISANTVEKIPYIQVKARGEVDWIYDNVCRMNLESLENNFFMDRGTVISLDLELLLTVGYDNLFTLLYGTKNKLENIIKEYPFEGFYADKNTKDLWHRDSVNWKRWWNVKIFSVNKYLRIKRMVTLSLKSSR